MFFYDSPVNKHDFLHLTRGIIEIFPSEDINLYYVAPISKKDSRSRKSISIRGKLVDKYRNKLRQTKRILTENSATSSTDQESESCNDSKHHLIIYLNVSLFSNHCMHYIIPFLVTNEVLETSIKWS